MTKAQQEIRRQIRILNQRVSAVTRLIIRAQIQRYAEAEKLRQTVIKSESALTREELAEALGIHPNGGRYGTDLAWLRTMGVIPERGSISPTEGLYK